MICDSNLDGPCMKEVFDEVEDVLIPCICTTFRIRYLPTISYAFSMLRHIAVSCCWLAKVSHISLSKLIK